MSTDQEKATVPTPTQRDIDWLNQRIDRVNERIDRMDKKIRAIYAVLIDKKLLSEELGKIFMESKTDEKKLDWLLKKVKSI